MGAEKRSETKIRDALVIAKFSITKHKVRDESNCHFCFPSKYLVLVIFKTYLICFIISRSYSTNDEGPAKATQSANASAITKTIDNN